MKNLWMGAVAALTAAPVLAPAPARAWHQEGHMAVALIAYRQLGPADQKKVQDVLRNHPHFNECLKADMPDDARADEWRVMRAAIWPDWVKNPPRAMAAKTRAAITKDFGHGDWHYVNNAIVVTDGADAETRAAIESNSRKPNGQAVDIYPKLIAALKNPADTGLNKLVCKRTDDQISDAQARAVALCWVLHLVGDIHQPLHAATLFTPDAPAGDAGGNGFFIQYRNPTDRLTIDRLHTFWDGGFGWDDLEKTVGSQFAAVDQLARDVTRRFPPTPAERGVTAIKEWSDESFQLAKDKAYAVDGVPLPGILAPGRNDPKPRATDFGSGDLLPRKYTGTVRTVAEKRVSLAGHRLIDVLAGL
jgi:hypothetical protein